MWKFRAKMQSMLDDKENCWYAFCSYWGQYNIKPQTFHLWFLDMEREAVKSCDAMFGVPNK
jgi:hypothetical protein